MNENYNPYENLLSKFAAQAIIETATYDNIIVVGWNYIGLPVDSISGIGEQLNISAEYAYKPGKGKILPKHFSHLSTIEPFFKLTSEEDIKFIDIGSKETTIVFLDENIYPGIEQELEDKQCKLIPKSEKERSYCFISLPDNDLILLKFGALFSGSDSSIDQLEENIYYYLPKVPENIEFSLIPEFAEFGMLKFGIKYHSKWIREQEKDEIDQYLWENTVIYEVNKVKNRTV